MINVRWNTVIKPLLEVLNTTPEKRAQANEEFKDPFAELYPPSKRYDEQGNLIYEKNKAGCECWYAYDSNRNIIYSKNSNEYEKWFDEKGNVIHYKDPDKLEGWLHKGEWVYEKPKDWEYENQITSSKLNLKKQAYKRYTYPEVLIALFEARDEGIYDEAETIDYIYQHTGIHLLHTEWQALQREYIAKTLCIKKQAYEGQPKRPYDNNSILNREPGPPEGDQDLGAPLSEDQGAANDDQWTGDEYDGLSNKPSTPGWTRKPDREKHLPEFNDTFGWPGGKVRQTNRDNMITQATEQLEWRNLINFILEDELIDDIGEN